MSTPRRKEDKKILSHMGKLSKEIRRHQELYYIKNETEISDLEFDKLLVRLHKLEKEHPSLASSDSPTLLVGSDLSNDFKKAEHSIPVLSLGNTYNIPELLEWAHKVASRPACRFHVQWKLDGASLVLYYEKGYLKQALTRGTGSLGDDVTQNALTIRSVPYKLKQALSLAVRGEVYMRYSDFKQFNKNFGMIYANPRNLAAGSLKHKKSSELAKRPLRWLAFDGELQGDSKEKHSYKKDQEMLKKMKTLGLPLGKDAVCVSLSDLKKTVEDFTKRKASLDFPVDGLVIKLDNLELRKKLGTTANAPRWAVAYKFKPEYAVSTVKAIESFVGRTGRVTPRATLEAVPLAGTTVRHATLHNADFIKKLDLRLGSEVKISKRGDIIPAIEEVISKGKGKVYSFPKECPSCESTLTKAQDMADWVCPNEDCPGKTLSRIIFFCGAKQMDIASLGEKLCQTLFRKGFLRSIPMIYQLQERKAELEKLEGLGERSVKLLLKGIENSKKKSFQDILVSLGLAEIGPNVSELLMEAGYNSYAKILDISTKEEAELKIKKIEQAKMPNKKAAGFFREYFPELSQIHGIGWSTAKAIIKQFNESKVQELFMELEKYGLSLNQITLKEGVHLPRVFAEQSWCLTGTFFYFKPRSLAIEEIKKRGGRISSSLSSNTTHLLIGQNPGAKAAKAEKLEIRLVPEEEFLKLLEQRD